MAQSATCSAGNFTSQGRALVTLSIGKRSHFSIVRVTMEVQRHSELDRRVLSHHSSATNPIPSPRFPYYAIPSVPIIPPRPILRPRPMLPSRPNRPGFGRHVPLRPATSLPLPFPSLLFPPPRPPPVCGPVPSRRIQSHPTTPRPMTSVLLLRILVASLLHPI